MRCNKILRDVLREYRRVEVYTPDGVLDHVEYVRRANPRTRPGRTDSALGRLAMVTASTLLVLLVLLHLA